MRLLLAACLCLLAQSALCAQPPRAIGLESSDAGAAASAASQWAGPRGAALLNLRAVIKPTTPVWPEVFSSALFSNRSGSLSITHLFYDWRHKRNLNLIQTQLAAHGEVYDVEHDNGTSFIFSRDPPLCKVLHFDVGILYPNWLENATLLGQDVTDGFVVNAWTKSDFINYYDDDASNRPVRWTFLGSGADYHVMAWSPGLTLPDARWQAPPWCFGPQACGDAPGLPACAPSVLDGPLATGRLLRMDAGKGGRPAKAAAAEPSGAQASW